LLDAALQTGRSPRKPTLTIRDLFRSAQTSSRDGLSPFRGPVRRRRSLCRAAQRGNSKVWGWLRRAFRAHWGMACRNAGQPWSRANQFGVLASFHVTWPGAVLASAGRQSPADGHVLCRASPLLCRGGRSPFRG
jgi:hypothetical protein